MERRFNATGERRKEMVKVMFFIFCTGISFLWLLAFIRKRKSIDYTYTACIAENRNNLYELINGITEIKVNNAHKIKVNKNFKN